MRIKIRPFLNFIKECLFEWNNDKGWLLSAALAYYMQLSIAPILVVIVAITGIILGIPDAEHAILSQVESLAGEKGTQALHELVLTISPLSKSIPAAIAGLSALFIGTSTFFIQLRYALNIIWKAHKPDTPFIKGIIKDRLVAFGIAISAGFMMVLLLISSSLLSALANQLKPTFGNAILLWKTLDLIFGYAFLTLLFALLYKYVPDINISLRSAWPGSITAVILFNVIKYLIGHYLAFAFKSIGSTYGAAGSFVVLLVWIFLTVQIFLLGSEITKVYVRRHPSKLTDSSKKKDR